MSSITYYDSEKDYYLQLSKVYYRNNREHILKHSKDKYNSLSKEEKDQRAIYAINWCNNLSKDKKSIKRANARKRYHSMSDDKMLKHKEYQKEYQKKYREIKRAQSNLAKNAVLTL